MAFHRDFVRQLADFLGQFLQQIFAEIRWTAVAGFEERRILAFDQFDSQTFAGYGKNHVLFDFLQRGRAL